LNTPILFLIFNRPDLTERVFARIRQARPKRLYVAADGPRDHHPGEAELCQATRQIATAVDWPCTVRTLLREHNLGCGAAVRGAIDWFFEHEEEGIILEDDCLPDFSFFRYSQELLEQYRDTEHIYMISGFNGVPGPPVNRSGLHFCTIPHIWGWATWRRAWRDPMPSKSDWMTFQRTKNFKSLIGSKDAEDFWRGHMDRFFEQKIDTWDFPWVWKIWMANGLCSSPGVNLVENIGFDERGTHTKTENPAMTALSVGSVEFPLQAGPIQPDRQWELATYRHHYRLRHTYSLKRFWKRIRKAKRAAFGKS